ncbi:hypothetical protein [Rhizobium sp. Root1220]|uniref:hypothetical protein n=1 Tax=Rhizobium sp. Root1220 TaxID=1736432 RepID=UPI0006FA42D4|nr:hypothetical protein [Rhizobium sp. Root1220]KQV66068.1 hypothetical protein ASC90_12735 [Rhizobium sp. Root1220]
MLVGSTSALNILSNPYSGSGGANAPTGSAGGARLTILQSSEKALDALRDSIKTSSDAAKQRAARKLEEAKQQLQMLKSGGFPPEVVARLAAELAHKISAAAAEFASAVAATASSATASANTVAADAGTGAAAEASAAANAEAALASTEDGSSSDSSARADEPDGASHARNAYQTIVEDGRESVSGISPDDRKTMEEFKSILRDVRQLMDKAMRDMWARNARRGQGDEAGHGAAFEAQVVAEPSSIIV